MSKYRRIIEQVFEQAGGDPAGNSSVLFDRDDIDVAAASLQLHIKNTGDIKYTFDSREDLTIGNKYYAIVQRGKGRYALAPSPEPALIRTPEIGESLLLPDLTPVEVRRYMGQDEQAHLTRLWYSEAFKAVLGCESVHKIQDHWRTTCSVGQVEIDGFFIAKWPGNRSKPVLLSVKKAPDLLSRSYLYSLSRLALEKIGPDTILLNLYLIDGACCFWRTGIIESPDDLLITTGTAVILT